MPHSGIFPWILKDEHDPKHSLSAILFAGPLPTKTETAWL